MGAFQLQPLHDLSVGTGIPLLLDLTPQLLGVFTPRLKPLFQIRQVRVEDAFAEAMGFAVWKGGCVVVLANRCGMTGQFLSKLSNIPPLMPQSLNLFIQGKALIPLLCRCLPVTFRAYESRSLPVQKGLIFSGNRQSL